MEQSQQTSYFLAALQVEVNLSRPGVIIISATFYCCINHHTCCEVLTEFFQTKLNDGLAQ